MKSSRSIPMASIFWLSVALGSVTLTPRQATSAWTIGEPIVTYWAGPGYDGRVPLTDAVAEQMVDLGMNVVWAASATEVDLAGRHGLRALYQDRTLLQPQSLNDPNVRSKLDATVDELRKKPALYGYHIVDEPPATTFAALGPLVDYLRERDPNHVARINLFPSNAEPAALDAADYAAYLNQFVSNVRPSLLSYDFYQFHTTYDYPTYLESLGIIREKAKSIRVPFMNFVQASKWAPDIRIPNANEERFLVYTTLAYGAQGIGYYVWCWPQHEGGIVNPDGTPTAIYNTLKSINREFVAIAKQYQSLNSIGAYMKGYASGQLPPGTTQLPSNSPFDISSLPNNMTYSDGAPLKGVLFGLFDKDGTMSADATLTILVNLDYTVSKTYTVTGPEDLSVFNAATGVWTATGRNNATVDLPPGGGVLVGLTSVVQ